MYKIEMDEMSPQFYGLWRAAIEHLSRQVQGGIETWLRCHSAPPFLDHLSFRLGNQNFFLRVHDADGRVEGPGRMSGLNHIAAENGGHACILLMKRAGLAGTWEAVRPGWGLVSPEDGRTIDPFSLVTDELIPMTPWEIHSMGVQVVLQQLHQDGVHVTKWQDDPNIDPTLWFQNKDDQTEWVLVRTVTYPARRAERPANWDEMIENLAAISRRGNFASVALSSADQPFDTEDDAPVPLWRGHGMYASFEGLEQSS